MSTTGPDPLDDACAEFDLASDFVNEHFFEVGERLVERCPVAHTNANGGYWLVSGYAETLAADLDHRSFSNANGVMVPPAEGAAPMYPPDLDPPRLREFRALLNPYFLQKRMRSIEGGAQSIADRLVAEVAPQGSCDIHEALSVPLPMLVLLELIVNATDDETRRVSEAAGAVFTSHDPAVVAKAYADFSAVVNEMLERRRSSPRIDDLVDSIIHGTVEGRPLTHEEQAATLFPVVAGGFDTTTSVLSAGIAFLAEHPEVQRQLRDDPSLIPDAAEELIRLFGSGLIGRTVAEDVQLGGQLLRRGEQALLAFPIANRDPAMFEMPSDFRLDRPNINRHLTFGLGPHRCPGANAARLYMRVGLRALLTTLASVELAGPVIWETGQTRTPRSVPITYVAAAGR